VPTRPDPIARRCHGSIAQAAAADLRTVQWDDAAPRVANDRAVARGWKRNGEPGCGVRRPMRTVPRVPRRRRFGSSACGEIRSSVDLCRLLLRAAMGARPATADCECKHRASGKRVTFRSRQSGATRVAGADRVGRMGVVEQPLRIITKKELRLMVPYTPQHILRLEKRGKFPKRIQIGTRRVGWYLHEVQAWLQQRSRGAPSFTAPSQRRA
jgi:prophage regulatory protein